MEERMAKSVLLIGLGRFGYHMAERMQELKDEVLGVDIDEDKVEQCLSCLTSAQIADATDENFIRTLGVRNFDVCVVAIGDNFQASLEVTALLKDFGAQFVVSRAAGEIHAKFLLRNGADQVIYPERDMARHAAVKYSANHVLDFFQLTPEYAIYEISAPKEWMGKSIEELQVRRKHHVNILAVRVGETVDPVVSPAYRFTGQESIFILGASKEVKPFL
ncbi:MAG: potassium transporter TrkA [Clostridiales bacterium]|jgi:trk system potassium uptake protein TrkA|nr:MAG: potassium transporter TrkA [Clostridiales bacterium]